MPSESTAASSEIAKRAIKIETAHHVIPKSRREKENFLPLGYEKGDLHRKFRELVGNKPETEAVRWIVENCWGGNWLFVEEALIMKDGGTMPEFQYVEMKVPLDAEIHKKYHRIFKNMTPKEIIIFLVVYMWNWGWHYVEEAIKLAS